MFKTLTLFLILGLMAGCFHEEIRMEANEYALLCEIGKVVTDDTQNDLIRTNAVKIYCEKLTDFVSRPDANMSRAEILRTLDIAPAAWNYDSFSYAFHLKEGAYYLSGRFKGGKLTSIIHGYAIE